MTCPPAYFDKDRLQRILAQEAEAVRLFSELLRNEHQVLTCDDTDKLPALADEKEKIAFRLKDFSEQRNAELRVQGCSADAEGMGEWRAKYPAEKDVAELWDAILSNAREAKELNRVNGELIKIRMDYNGRALEILRHGNDPLELYGSDGQSRKEGITRIDDAA
jgi:flagella synthesis protein FlgN